MSRIRSVHPGLWTDEAFMSLSAFARLLCIGLWNEAFDDGVFEWKPLTIKARIFPVDSVDVAALLAELVAADCIQARGKYGLIRNFRHYQRPKKPNSSGLLLPEDHEYVGIVPNQLPTSTELVEQMEDGGGEKEDEEKSPPSPPPGEGAGLFDRLLQTYPRSNHTRQDKAERFFLKLSKPDQELALEQARLFEIQQRTEAGRRSRPMWDHAEFVPGLDTWLRESRWKPKPAATSQPIVSMTKLDRELDAELWAACERVMGKKAPTSGLTWSFDDAVIEKARAAA